jgi:hypothetical protein
MSRQQSGPQGHLFADAGQEPMVSATAPEDFIARIRAELLTTLATAEAAAVLPWSNLTKAYLAEMRFHSIANWLPEAEAKSLQHRFASALERLYAATEDTGYGSAPGQSEALVDGSGI